MLFEYLLNESQGPEAENILAAYEPARFFHARLNQRAPDAIYKLSLRQVWPAFGSAMDAAEYIVQERPFLTLHDRCGKTRRFNESNTSCTCWLSTLKSVS
jgi:hypothetical protein